MGTKQQPPGLLSKVARYFRASDSDQASAQDSLQTRSGETDKNPLTDLIERKRQDDLVRRREFNHLRKLRKQQHGTETLGGEGIGRPSVFQHSSGYGADDRASTLQKINAIEAHMVNAWARGKAPTEARMARRTAQPAAAKPAPPPGAAPLPVLTERRVAPAAESPVSDDFDLDFTGMLLEPAAPAPEPAAPPAPEAAPQPEPSPALAPASAPAAAVATPVVDEAPPSPLESGLQDAAMRFAEGDNAAAEAVLLGLLQGEGINAETVDSVVFALFDLYRATGQQDGFDVVAMDYAERFGRSPAEWFSLPDRLGRGAAAATAPVASRGMADQGTAWVCPAVLDAAALTALQARFPGPTANWHVDWSLLATIEPQAATALSEVFAYWCTHPVQLHWHGVDQLLHALELHTPADDPSVDPVWWRMRLDALCILQRQDAFDGAALDYCVVYEVSPPSWKSVQCTCVQDAAPSAFANLAEDSIIAPLEDAPGSGAQIATCDLVGELTGDAAQALADLYTASQSAPDVVVSCALLARADFSAASAILNWATASTAEGRHIRFVQVPRLVAQFFRMLGLDHYAHIAVRAN
jgi:anti-anti-sigma regulatory factor